MHRSAPAPDCPRRLFALPLASAFAAQLALAPSAVRGVEVFRQDFERSALVSDYAHATAPGPGQFNDLSAGADGGEWSIDDQGRLRLERRGINSAQNGAGFIRFAELPGPSGLLHARFDLGVVLDSAQGDAVTIDFGRFTTKTDYRATSVANNVFLRLAIDAAGRRTKGFFFEISGQQSGRHEADGRMYPVEIYMNQSGFVMRYRGPDGSARTLDHGRAAVWADKLCVFDNVEATNGGGSALTGFRVRMPGADKGIYLFDNFVFDREFPSFGWNRIRLRPDMLLADASAHDAAKLLDEQEAAGVSLVTSAEGPLPTHDWARLPRPVSRPATSGAASTWEAVVDLGDEHELSHVCLHREGAVSAAAVRIEHGTPYGWTELFRLDGDGSDGGWARQRVAVKTRFVRLSASAGAALPSELLLYGQPASSGPR